ncbi:MAG: hypothetical protein GXN98_02675, partial [Euryarchaeota archaeon]|nr:hypothetical protein [Euryarchaeota archaeon]
MQAAWGYCLRGEALHGWLMSEDEIRQILESSRSIAVVGCSTNPVKDAHRVPKVMLEAGYRVIPVN